MQSMISISSFKNTYRKETLYKTIYFLFVEKGLLFSFGAFFEMYFILLFVVYIHELILACNPFKESKSKHYACFMILRQLLSKRKYFIKRDEQHELRSYCKFFFCKSKQSTLFSMHD